ncbi:MAG: hypothetical protein HY200_11105 [Nitrospirae bacterium]|nr:hypothetical protein [Nitrospirota bacterium]
MREHRWESLEPLDFDHLMLVCEKLKASGLKTREIDEDRACYFDEFSVERLDEVSRLSPWVMDELTLVELNREWKGDFFLLAGRHHDLFRMHERMEAYLSISHLWKIPSLPEFDCHEPEAVVWIGFRDTHGFIRIRLIPKQIMTPGETPSEKKLNHFLSERSLIFSLIVAELELPISVERAERSVTFFSTDPSALVSSTWPDALGPCQFEFVVTDRYSLLVPASRFVLKFGMPLSPLRTFLSGFPLNHLEQFHSLQPDSELFYRGFIQAPITDLPEIISAVSPNGKGLINLCDFQIEKLFSMRIRVEGVLGIIGDRNGYKLEARLNRLPSTKTETMTWLQNRIGMPLVYSPLPVF